MTAADRAVLARDRWLERTLAAAPPLTQEQARSVKVLTSAPASPIVARKRVAM
jgi:hypothetical protein